ncbi:dTDP-4-dehydrorhamnose reductase [Mesorhizobium sp. B2-1-3A]|uniref:dTDP-4-dehydrorhamnose reductase n=1 Tax=Mesorhizobium sp. B2-1-3A TaxID=2589971 RepID=UPI0011264360|nr:dTDP-4-dehydrorhamnose reductase [Mesorhizobium sp. B2-1-3A]TPM95030.1 dTDP-4-dehydrorhamnose reductase [Mesorhizobium sp. B2-1-3A]
MVDVWGGIECSLVRIGDTVRDQVAETGHADRIDDLDRIAALGIRTLRYPALWENVEAVRGQYHWDWLDERLGRLQSLGITPLVGLLHHGSGPSWTHILAPDFTDSLADFAGRLAHRYPWLTVFTPVNEPLATARLSGLYGIWQPHGTDEATCFRLLVAQCRAIAKAMVAIRRITPQAQLLQTEDVGKIFATPPLQYQADYENERRWLSLDLLCGRIDETHNFYDRLLAAGVDADHLADLSAKPCPPDLLGVDYYLTSDRYLDHSVERHPNEPMGGNGVEPYVDIAAFRGDGPADELGLRPRLHEVWNRYRIPLVVGELHNGCTREEQLRWFLEGWRAAEDCNRAGADIRAVTAWSLFGAFDWNSMMRQSDGYYECGVFDARADPPRRTVIADAIAALARGQPYDHPVLAQTGWWRPPSRSGAATPTIQMRGFGRVLSSLAECCSRRRLTAQAAHERAGERAWVEISVEAGPAPVLHAHYSDGATFGFHTYKEADWMAACNAFLDLVVDGLVGEFRLVEASANNQYRIIELAQNTAVGSRRE